MRKPEFNKEMFMSYINKDNAVNIGVGAILSVALIGGGICSWNHNKYMDEMQKQIETAKTEQAEYTVGNDIAGFDFDSIPYVKDGYSNIDDYWGDIQSMRSGANGMANAAINNYGAYMSDKQKSQLRQYENSMTGAATIEDFNEAKKKFNAIVNDCKPVIVYVDNSSSSENASSNTSSSKKPSSNASSGGSYNLRRDGIIHWGGYRFTWYSQRVLPGGGLRIPNRHVNGAGFVCDGDGYIVAATAMGRGTVGNSPWGAWKSYDTGVSGNTVDLYTNW